MGVVDEPVEDAAGQRRIADLSGPARYRQLRSQDRGAQKVELDSKRNRLVSVLGRTISVRATFPITPAWGQR